MNGLPLLGKRLTQPLKTVEALASMQLRNKSALALQPQDQALFLQVAQRLSHRNAADAVGR